MKQLKKTLLTLVALLAVTTGAWAAVKVSKITIDEAYYQKIGSDYKIIVTGYVRDLDDNDINKGTVSIYLNDESKGSCAAEFGMFSCEVDVVPGKYNVRVRYHDDSGDYDDSQNEYYDNPIIIKAPDPVTWYVDGNKSYGNDGKSEASAFSTLNEALYAASNNDTVKIAAGTYTGSANIGGYIQKILTFEKYGDGEVIFDGGGQRIWSVGVNTINIYGLTFINGGSDNGGALYFLYDLSNSVINATFRDNSVNKYGGAIYVDNSVSNLTLRSTFINNTAKEDGAAVYIKSTASNLILNSTFINNTAKEDGGGVYIGGNADNVKVYGEFINNNGGNSIIYIGNSVSGNSIQNSVFLNNEAYKIFFVNNGEITAKNNWFGSNATNYYKIPEDVGIDLENWLFLNATADPSELEADEKSTIIFKLSSFDGSEISDYDASKMNIVLDLSQTLGELNKNTTSIGEEVIYTAKQEGNASVTGKVGNVEYTIPITVNKSSTPVEDFTWDATTKTGTFTMPESDVIVKVEYKSEATVSMNVTGTGGTAKLMDATFQPLATDAKVKEGERFVLYLDRQNGYDFTTTFSKGGDTKEYMQEFSNEEYENYINYAKENGIQVPLNGALMWVTMPDTDDEALTMTTTFEALKTYTVLYKTTGSPTEVWARLGITENDAQVFRAVKMQPDMAMGDGTQVWSLKMQSAFDPKQVGFFTTKEAAEAEDAQTAAATVSQSATNWNDVNGAQYLIIGGEARTVYAAFVTDGSKVRIYNEASATFDGKKADDKQGVSYRIAVCQGNNAGKVSTFIPTAPEGKEFGAWIAVKNQQEVIITDVRDYEISENTTFTAIWLPKQLRVSVNANNGLDKSQSNIQYGQTLTLSEPTRRGFAFNGWAVDKTVTESGKLFGRGAAFDMTTPLTADLGLTAQWKHVHEYVKYQISQFGDALKNYQKYNGIFHIAICNCDDVELVAHEFNPAGKCACGYEKPGSENVQLDIAYGRMNGTTFQTYMLGFPEFAKRGDEVKIDAPHMWGSNMQFKKWQYSTNGQNWYDLAAFEIVGFLIPRSMQVRAIYESNVTEPQLELQSSNYLEPYTYNGQTYKMDNILFQMDYKLPDGYKLIDAGIRMGDNAGISYYEQKERRYSFDGEAKAIAIGMLTAVSILNGEPTTADMSTSEQYWAERENSVLDELTPAALAKKMYESKPVNVPKYDPIYWEAKAKTTGLTGTIATLPPLRFAQKNNQQHYIYGMAYLRYKDKQGKEQAIYTPAIAATAKNPNGSVRRALPTEDEKLDMSTMLAPETQLTVNVDGKYDAQLSDAYGYGEKAVVTAPDVQGKQFSYWTTANGAVFSTSKEVTITMNANTKLNAVYGAEQKSAAPAITSATRNDNGQRIVLHAIATGDVSEAGFVYSTTNAEPTADAEGVTKVTAVSYSSLATNGNDKIPASILDANNCWSLQITPAEQEQDAVHHVRAYVKNGNTITYGDVMDVRLASLKNELMMIANVDAFENGIETAGIEALLTQLREEGKLVAGYAVEVPAGEYATYYNDKVLKVEDTDAQLFTVTAIEDGKAVTEQVKVAAANTPLLVMNNSTETKTFLLMPTEDAADQVDVADEFLGTLTDMTFTAEETKTANYYVCNGKEFIKVRGAGTLAANKAYLFVEGNNAPASIPFRRSIGGEGEGTTSIDNVNVNDNLNDNEATWYDLNGRRLQGKPSQKGVYIKNGRKVVLK